MADNTHIEWADATVNAINGCSVVSPGCTNCYAMRLAGTRLKHHPSRAGLTTDTKAGPVWNGQVHLYEPALLQPLKWRRPRRIFWNAHGDPFHPEVPFGWVDREFAVMALTPQHIHMVLTKRPDRMREHLGAPGLALRLQQRGFEHHQTHPKIREEILAGIHPSWFTPKGVPLSDDTRVVVPNVWLGTSVEDQKRADERIPELLATPAAVRFLSCEPLLGRVDICEYLGIWWNQTTGEWVRERPSLLHWVIVGGESGPRARPMHPDWARLLRDQCAAAGVPFFMKQWGTWALDTDPLPKLPDPALAMHHGRISMYQDGTYMGRGFFPEDARKLAHLRRVGKKAAGRLLDGVEHNGVPK